MTPTAGAVVLVRDRLERGSLWLPIRGASMAPTLEDGDSIRIRRARLNSLAVGDLAVYETDGRVVCHRVVLRAPWPWRWLLVAGDARAALVTRVAATAVIGIVVAVRHRGTRRSLGSPWARFRARALALRRLVELVREASLDLGRLVRAGIRRSGGR